MSAEVRTGVGVALRVGMVVGGVEQVWEAEAGPGELYSIHNNLL